MKLKLFTLLVLVALFVTIPGTALAQGPLPPADNDGFTLPSKSELPPSFNGDNLAGGNSIAGATLIAGSITNGGFEQGSAGWSQSSSHGYALIYNRTSDFLIPTHTGSWVAWLGGDNYESAVLSQSGLTIDSSASTLWVWYSIYSNDDCGWDYGYVRVNSDLLYTWDLCTATASKTWKALSLDLSSYVGQTVTLSLSATTDQGYPSDLLIDDVGLGKTFADVPNTNPYYNDVQILAANSLTGGCQVSPPLFCPDQIMNRAQAAAFMMRGNFGPSFVPPTPIHMFADDWSKGTWAEGWAEGMFNNGFSAGCLANPLKYCPWTQIPREQAVIFALKMKYGQPYTPPQATGTLFADMTNPSFYATAWAEQAYLEGIILACGTSGGKPMFCPKTLVSRGLAAYMIVRAKSLTMP